MGFQVAADINAKLNQQSMSTALASLKSQFQNQGVDLKVNIPDLTKNASGFRLVADSVDKTTNSIEKFGEQAGIATKRLLAYTAATTAILGPLAVLRSAVDEAIKFQREIVRVSQVAGDTKTELKGLQDQITSLAKNLGVSSLELAKSATIFRQAGFNAKETADSVEVLAKALLAPNFDNGAQISETIVALKSQFKEATKDAAALADTIGGINAVAGAFAVEAKDLEETIKRAGGAFAAAGGKVEELTALFTSVRATTRESAESIATSFRTIFARLQRADIIDQLKSFGIELRRTKEEALGLGNAKLEGQFVGAYEAIRRLSAAVKDLPTTDQRFAAIAEEIGGYRQLSKVIPLLQQFATAQEALNVAQSGAASLNVNAAQAQDAYTTKITKVKEEVAELGRTIVGSQGFRQLFEFFSSAASGAVTLANAIAPLIPLITTLATIKLATSIGGLFRGVGQGFLGRTDSVGRAIQRADGGTVPGSGSGDTVPAMLTPGEFVLRKDAVNRIGLSTLNAMNASKPQGYARGGIVGGVQFFAGGGSVDKAIASFDDGKSISLSAKNANVSVADLTKALGEQGKLTAENTANLGKVAKAIAESYLNKNTTTSTAAAAVSAAPVVAATSGLAGSKNTVQRDLFHEDLLPGLTDQTGLAPLSGSGRRKNTSIVGDLDAQRVALGLAPGPDPSLAPASASNRGPIAFKLNSLPVAPDPNLLPASPSNRGQLNFKLNSLPVEPDPNLLPGSASNRGPLAFDPSRTVSTPLPSLAPIDASGRNSNFLKNSSVKSSALDFIPDDLKLAPLPGAKQFGGLGLPIVPAKDNIGSTSGGLSAATIKEFGLDKPTKTGFFSNLFRDDRRGNGVEATGKSLLGLADRATSFLDRPATAIGKGLLDPLGTLASGINVVGNGAQRVGGLVASGTRSAINATGNFINGLPGDTLLGKAGNLAGNGISGIGTGILNSVGLGANGSGVRGAFNSVGSKLGSIASNPLALTGAFFAAEQLRGSGNKDITAAQAAQGPLSGAFKQQEGTKEALSGAQIGAGVGAVFGPLGLALGGITGAIIGYADGIKEAEKKISQVKLDEVLGKLKTEIDDNAGQKAGTGTGNINALLGSARSASFANTNKGLEPSAFDNELGFAARASNRLFGTNFKDPSQAVNAETAVFQQRENFRNQIGLQLPQLNQIAGRQATNAATTASQTGALGGDFNPQLIKREGERFASGFAAANDELVRDIALIKQVSIGTVVKEFQKQFEEQAKALSLAKNTSNAKAGTNNVLESVERLTKAFDAAAEAATESARANSTILDLFNGGNTAVQSRNLGAGASNLGVIGEASQESFNRTSGVVNNALGGGGGSFGQAIAGLNQLEQQLPDILVNALKSNPAGGDAFTVRVREQLNKTGATEQQKNAAIARLEPLTGDMVKFAERVKESSEKLAKEVTADSDPLKAAFAKIAQDINTQSNAFITGLSQADKNSHIADTAGDRATSLGVNRLRTQADFRVADTLRQNRFADVKSSDFLSERDAELPFTSKQERLIGNNGLSGQNPADFVKLIGEGQSKLEQLGKARDAAQGGPNEKKAATDFQNQQNANASLIEGLKNLSEDTTRSTDATKRLGDINDRLSRVQAARQTGLSLNERVFRAQSNFDFKDLDSLDKGLRGNQFLRAGGNIKNIQDPEVAKATADFIAQNPDFRPTVAKRDANGRILRNKDGSAQTELGISNAELREKGNVFGQGPFDAGQKGGGQAAEQAKLDAAAKAQEARIANEQKVQTEAANAYVKVLTTANDSFIAKLNATFDKFGETVKQQKTDLESNIAKNERNSAEADKAGFQSTTGVAKADLAKAGITTQQQLDLLKANSGDLANSGKLTDKFLAANDIGAINKAKEAAAGVLQGDSSLTGVQNKDTGQLTLDATSRDKLQLAFERAGFTDNKTNARLVNQAESRLGHGENIQPTDLVKSIVGNEFSRQSDESLGDLTKVNGRILNNFRQANQGALGTSLVNSTANGGITGILDSSNKVGSSLKAVDDRLASFDQSIQNATNTLNALNPKFVGPLLPPAVGKAFGGSIFSSRGTDTVPAMLTPGEFVVSANAARNNLGLLQSINNHGQAGPVNYKASGGSISVNRGTNVDNSGFDANTAAMKAAFDSFVTGSQSLVSALNNFPREIQGTFSHKVEVIHNGVEMFANLQPNIVSLVEANVEKALTTRDNKLRAQGFNI